MADEALKAAQAAGAFQSAVGGGELHFPVGAAAKCAGHCDEFASAVDQVVRLLEVAQAVDGFGSLTSGTELQAGFKGKADQANQFLKSYYDSIGTLATSFRTAEAAYTRQDGETADNIAAKIPGAGE